MIAPQPGTPRTIYVQWSGDGQHIRKWSMAEFDLAERLIAETMSVSDPKAQALADALLEALKAIDGEGPAREVASYRTTGDADEAFDEGVCRGLAITAAIARTAIAKAGAA